MNKGQVEKGLNEAISSIKEYRKHMATVKKDNIRSSITTNTQLYESEVESLVEPLKDAINALIYALEGIV